MPRHDTVRHLCIKGNAILTKVYDPAFAVTLARKGARLIAVTTLKPKAAILKF